MLRSSFEPLLVTLIPIEELSTSDSFSLRSEDIDSPELEGLAASIRKQGVLQPFIVRRKRVGTKDTPRGSPAMYEVICGNRRFWACKKIGFKMVPAIVRDLEDREALEIALIENLQRESLNPIEEAEAFKKYVVNYGRGSITSLASRIGKSEEYVSHRLMLLGLPKEITEKISRRLLKPGQACELVWLKDPEKQTELAKRILSHGLSFRQTRSAVKLLKGNSGPMEEVIHRVMSNSVDGAIQHHTVSGELARDAQNFEPWPYSTVEPGNLSKGEMEPLKHAALILRTCLSGLDVLLEKPTTETVHAEILKERRAVHESLDRIVQAQVAVRRGNRDLKN